MKRNYMKVKGGIFTWKQVEVRDGRKYIRVARRPFFAIKGME